MRTDRQEATREKEKEKDEEKEGGRDREREREGASDKACTFQGVGIQTFLR